jgi:hypothetical protein
MRHFDSCLIHTDSLRWSAAGEGVSFVSRWTAASRDVIDDVANCVLSAGTDTRIDTFEVAARPVGGTIGVHGALRSATSVRISLVLRQARAGAISALTIGSTR